MPEVHTTAAAFHPMRGHVQAGARVDFANGTTLFVQPSGKGWTLFVQPSGKGWTLCNSFGDRYAPAEMDAYELTAEIVRIDNEGLRHA